MDYEKLWEFVKETIEKMMKEANVPFEDRRATLVSSFKALKNLRDFRLKVENHDNDWSEIFTLRYLMSYLCKFEEKEHSFVKSGTELEWKGIQYETNGFREITGIETEEFLEEVIVGFHLTSLSAERLQNRKSELKKVVPRDIFEKGFVILNSLDFEKYDGYIFQRKPKKEIWSLIRIPEEDIPVFMSIHEMISVLQECLCKPIMINLKENPIREFVYQAWRGEIEILNKSLSKKAKSLCRFCGYWNSRSFFCRRLKKRTKPDSSCRFCK